MKQGLQLKLHQQIALTPELTRAIRLLQLSTPDLQQEITYALESNPLLNLIEDDDPAPDISYEAIQSGLIFSNHGSLSKEMLPIARTSSHPQTGHVTRFSERQSNDHVTNPPPSLHEHLLWQASLSHFDETEYAIATELIEAINEQGYLTQSPEELAANHTDPAMNVAAFQAVLARVQQFEPTGIGTQTLQDSLLLQLNQLNFSHPYYREAKNLLAHHFHLLGQSSLATLVKITRIDAYQLKQALHLIRSLDRRPGERYSTNATHYIIPDIFIIKQGQRWLAVLNDEQLPNIRINQHYTALIQKMDVPDQQFIRDSLQQAKWLIKSLTHRQETLLNVAQCIVDQQYAFFEKGESAMKPMILSDVAQKVGMHESTVSRATNQKYLQCARGVFELKYFFSNAVNHVAGVDTSATAIKARIKTFIANENSQHPFSDQALVSLLQREGITVARRTVTKYRESLAIPTSVKRKRELRL